jgi:hypothetical protein
VLLLVVLASMRGSFRAVCLPSGLDVYLYAWMRTGTHVRKLGVFTYKVLQTHVNGTLTIELKHGISERINIRRVIPYKE